MQDKGENESILKQSRELMIKTDVALSDEQVKAYGDSIRVLLNQGNNYLFLLKHKDRCVEES